MEDRNPGKGQKIQGGAGGGVIQRMALSRNDQVKATTRTVSHGGIAGGRSHGGEGLHVSMGNVANAG